MRLAIVHARAGEGVEAAPVTVEVHVSGGLPSLSIVGLPEAAVRESKDRVRGALLTGGFEFPARRITINLAPADLPKQGGRFDLAIAVGILVASGQLPPTLLPGLELIGELALSGALRPVSGTLPAAIAVRRSGRALVVPAANAAEAALVSALEVRAAESLLEVAAHLAGREALPQARTVRVPAVTARASDLADVRGQALARRTLEVAAAGGHGMLMCGPPGSGKTMLATRLPGLLPPLDEEEALETAAVHSLSDSGFDAASWRCRPFRAPHHSASGIALVGGGAFPRPGEISLAHNGVLFLDELGEFDRRTLDLLRQPMESGVITVVRAARRTTFPARFQLLAAMNPCPCGYLGDPHRACRCTAEQVGRYRSRVSGPLLDRIDLQIEVPPVTREVLARKTWEEDSATVGSRVIEARARQRERGRGLNGRLRDALLEQVCPLAPEASELMVEAARRLRLSARAWNGVLRVARTIADLGGRERIAAAHIAEAVQYRCLDRSIPGSGS